MPEPNNTGTQTPSKPRQTRIFTPNTVLGGTGQRPNYPISIANNARFPAAIDNGSR